jgi:hypothetical protein
MHKKPTNVSHGITTKSSAAANDNNWGDFDNDLTGKYNHKLNSV